MKGSKRKSITFNDKIKIYCDIKDNVSYESIIQKYSISESTFYRIKRSNGNFGQEEDNFSGSKRKSQAMSKFHEINGFIARFIKECNSYCVPISDSLIKETALKYSHDKNITGFKSSTGWLRSIKDRHNLKTKAIFGELHSSDYISAGAFVDKLHDIIGDYADENIFNLDETGLFWRLLPERTVISAHQKPKGVKKAKERVTILFCVSRNGEKLSPLIIGKSKMPRGVSHEKLSALNILYEGNATAWLTRDIFRRYLTMVNNKCIMENRKILMLLDNFSGHVIDSFSNVELAFLPPNTSCLIQPLDQGIIQNFKVKYKKAFLQTLISNSATEIKSKLKSYKMLSALENISISWNMVTALTIINCFQKLFTYASTDTLSNSDYETKDLESVMEKSEKMKIVMDKSDTLAYVDFEDRAKMSTYKVDSILEHSLKNDENEPNTRKQFSSDYGKTISQAQEAFSTYKESLYVIAPHLIHNALELESKLNDYLTNNYVYVVPSIEQNEDH